MTDLILNEKSKPPPKILFLCNYLLFNLNVTHILQCLLNDIHSTPTKSHQNWLPTSPIFFFFNIMELCYSICFENHDNISHVLILFNIPKIATFSFIKTHISRFVRSIFGF